MNPELRSALEEAHIELSRKMLRLDRLARSATGERRDRIQTRSQRLLLHVLQIHDELNAGRHRAAREAAALDAILSGQSPWLPADWPSPEHERTREILEALRDRLKGGAS